VERVKERKELAKRVEAQSDRPTKGAKEAIIEDKLG